jgi:hypothetical protein
MVTYHCRTVTHQLRDSTQKNMTFDKEVVFG